VSDNSEKNIGFYIHLKYLANETWRFLQVPSNADRGEGGEDDNVAVAPWNKKDEDGTSGSEAGGERYPSHYKLTD
jgi:hypothetical protein